MNFINVPGMKGVQTLVGSWGQIIGGLLFSLAEFVKLVTDCVSGATALDICVNNFPLVIGGLVVAFNGLSQLGLGSKVEEVKATTKDIQSTTNSTEKTVDTIEKAV